MRRKSKRGKGKIKLEFVGTEKVALAERAGMGTEREFVARGEARSDSDIDLLVQFLPGAKTYDRFLALSETLEARLASTVELVTVEALSPFLGPHILAEARVSFELREYLRHIHQSLPATI